MSAAEITNLRSSQTVATARPRPSGRWHVLRLGTRRPADHANGHLYQCHHRRDHRRQRSPPGRPAAAPSPTAPPCGRPRHARRPRTSACHHGHRLRRHASWRPAGHTDWHAQFTRDHFPSPGRAVRRRRRRGRVVACPASRPRGTHHVVHVQHHDRDGHGVGVHVTTSSARGYGLDGHAPTRTDHRRGTRPRRRSLAGGITSTNSDAARRPCTANAPLDGDGVRPPSPRPSV